MTSHHRGREAQGRAYYNEIDPFAAEWLRGLIARGLIAPGDIDTRSIIDVRASDLRGYAQCHFFAGIGGWSYALRLAGWDDNRPVWTGSCPCQPFSVAGKQKGFDDERHLWPVWRELIRQCAPAVVFGEQVAGATDWLRSVRSDLEAMGRAVGAMPIQAACAGADQYRDRYCFVAYRQGDRQWEPRQPQKGSGPSWTPGRYSQARQFLRCADDRSRPIEPDVRLLAHGLPNRVGTLRGFGNAIDPRPTAAFIEASDRAIFCDCENPEPDAGVALVSVECPFHGDGAHALSSNQCGSDK